MTQPCRLASFFADGKRRYGLVREDGAVDLSTGAEAKWPTLREVIADGALSRLAEAGEARVPDFRPGEFTYDLPAPRPEKLICVGVNYPYRNEEYKDGQGAQSNPSSFIRFPRSFVGHGAPIMRPKVSEQLEYEGEIVVVIGKEARHIEEKNALQHIAALSLCNEGTIRDWVRHAKFNVTQGKNFDSSGSLGPWLVPFETESQIADVALTTRVNGEIRQQDRGGRMIFSFRRLIAYISTFTTLVPGDVIVTGAPTGASIRLSGSSRATSSRWKLRESVRFATLSLMRSN